METCRIDHQAALQHQRLVICVIARADTIFRPHFLAVRAAAHAMLAGGTPIGGAALPSLVTNTIGGSITTAPAVGFPLILSQMGLRMSLP